MGCKHNLYLDITASGSIVFNHPGEPWEPLHSCALDLIDAVGPVILEAVGEMLGLTRERVRQIEEQALQKVMAVHGEWARRLFADCCDETPFVVKISGDVY